MKPKMKLFDLIVLGAPALFCGGIWMYYRDQKYLQPERERRKQLAITATQQEGTK
jgi:hypothetical protein